jgi:hypothetical protein
MDPSRIEQSRRALVTTAADLLQDIARAKKLHSDALDRDGAAAPEPAARPDPGGDLLVDFVRLQVDYLLRLGELGRAHRDHAFRTLEFLYRAVVPANVFAAAASLHFSTGTPAQAFIVENREAHLDELTLRAIVPKPLRATFYRVGADADAKVLLAKRRLELPPGTRVTILVELAHIDRLSGGVHNGEVLLSLAQRERSLPVRIEAPHLPKVEL